MAALANGSIDSYDLMPRVIEESSVHGCLGDAVESLNSVPSDYLDEDLVQIRSCDDFDNSSLKYGPDQHGYVYEIKHQRERNWKMRHDCRAVVTRGRVLPGSLELRQLHQEQPTNGAAAESTVINCVGSTQHLQSQSPHSPNSVPLPGSHAAKAAQSDLPKFERTDLQEVQGWMPLPGSAGFGIDSQNETAIEANQLPLGFQAVQAGEASLGRAKDGVCEEPALPCGVWGSGRNDKVASGALSNESEGQVEYASLKTLMERQEQNE